MDLVEVSRRIVGDLLNTGEPLPYEEGNGSPEEAPRLTADRRWLSLDDA
ncbi:hypothetical protein ACPCAE_30815 [Streptomyces cinereoruber]